jgi:hypothetical protein
LVARGGGAHAALRLRVVRGRRAARGARRALAPQSLSPTVPRRPKPRRAAALWVAPQGSPRPRVAPQAPQPPSHLLQLRAHLLQQRRALGVGRVQARLELGEARRVGVADLVAHVRRHGWCGLSEVGLQAGGALVGVRSRLVVLLGAQRALGGPRQRRRGTRAQRCLEKL